MTVIFIITQKNEIESFYEITHYLVNLNYKEDFLIFKKQDKLKILTRYIKSESFIY